MNRIKNADLIGGVALIVVGLYFFIGAFHFAIGSPSHMGPGFYPMVVSGAVLICAVVIVANSLRTAQLPHPVAVRPMLAVFAGIAAFGVSMSFFGFIPAAFLGVAVSAYGDRSATLKRAIILGIVTAFLAWIVFDLLLGLPMPAIKGFN